MKRIVIVGGGISGLALAHLLERRLPDAAVTVLERESRPGGKIDTVRRDGFTVEAGPNGFLDNKPFMTDLCREVGLGGRLIPASEAARRNRFLLLGGRLRRLPGGLFSFLTSGVLSWRGKWRLWGAGDLVHYYNRDRTRPKKETARALEASGRIRPTITPDDPNAVARILAERATS